MKTSFPKPPPEEYMQMHEGKEHIDSCLLWLKRYAEYVYTPRHPV